MSAPLEHEDGALQPALQALDDAVHKLCGPQTVYAGDKLVQAPSRYLQLQGATHGEQSNTGGGGGSKSRPPFWCDAFDLINEIDVAVEVWQPAYTGVPATVGRLHWLLQRSWRPQDTKRVEQLAENIRAWAVKVDQLLDPPRRWTLPSPCPACATTTVYRRDNGGEMIRQPALQIGPTGCFCAKCHAEWGPDKFVWLSRLLGSMPENVLE